MILCVYDVIVYDAMVYDILVYDVIMYDVIVYDIIVCDVIVLTPCSRGGVYQMRLLDKIFLTQYTPLNILKYTD